jgi:hypothetical protein
MTPKTRPNPPGYVAPPRPKPTVDYGPPQGQRLTGNPIQNKIQPIIDTVNSIKAATKKPATGGGSLGFVNKLKDVISGAANFKKGGKTTTLHSIKKSSKKSNW